MIQGVATEWSIYKQSVMQISLCAMQIPYLYFGSNSPFRQEWYDIILTIYIWIVTSFGELNDAITNEAFSTDCLNILVNKANDEVKAGGSKRNANSLYQFYVKGIIFLKNELGGKYYKSFSVGYVFTIINFNILMLCLQIMHYDQIIPNQVDTFDFTWLTIIFSLYVLSCGAGFCKAMEN